MKQCGVAGARRGKRRTAEVLAVMFGAWALGCASPSFANGVDLWRGFHHGTAADALVTQLVTLPEIASAKSSKPNKYGITKISVKYKSEGFELFDHKFVADFKVTQEGLSSISLTSGNLCVDDGAKLMDALLAVLQEKYPNHIAGPKEFHERDGRSLALTASLRNTAQKVTSAFDNGSTAVVIWQVFSHAPYPSYLGGSQLNRTLYQLQKTLYESSKGECGGTGDDRSGIMIKYVPKAEMDAVIASATADQSSDVAAARAGL